MKTQNIPKNVPGITSTMSERRRIPMALFTVIIMLLTLSVKAGNILVNPSFESSPLFASGSWSQHATVTWSMNAGSAWAPHQLTRTGGNSFWMQGVYNGGNNTTYAAQDFACFPGNTYTADCWYSAYVTNNVSIGGSGGSGSGLFGSDATGNEDGWIEVRFLDSGNNLLADYKSTIITPSFCTNAAATLPLVANAYGSYLPWEDFPVTNQYDVSTLTPGADPASNGTITNTLAPGQLITTPAGAVKVEFRISMFQAQYESGAPFYDDANLTQVAGPSPSVIGNLAPDGTQFFNTNANFTFNITSASAGGAPLPTNSTSAVSIVVNGANETGSLLFSGPSTNLSITLPGLTTNSIYTITVNTTNSDGLASSKSVYFDTFPANSFIVTAEDYDYTNGLFFENPTPTSAPGPNSYNGLAGTLGVDESTYGGTGTLPGGSGQLVRSDNHVAMQRAGDIQLPLYAAQNDPNVYNVQIAYNNPGNWENYTRNYPVGNYLVYMRYNNANAGATESLNLLTSGYGTPSQTVTNLGEFIGAATGANYAWVPLTDAYGNKIIVNLAAGQNTLQLFSGGLENFVSFMFVPVSGNFPPVINNITPNSINAPANGGVFFTNTTITFSVSSHFSTVASANIHTMVNGVDLSSSATYSGNNTNWSVSVPCPQNQIINLAINATDANGLSNSLTESFDTFSQSNLMVEGVDFDFNGGQFIDNPAPTAPLFLAANSYYAGGLDQTNFAYTNIDYHGFSDGGGEAWPYRPLDQGVGQEITSDFLRSKFINADGAGDNASDYDMGYWNGGFWENYTRTIPYSSYNVYGRLAGGAGPFSGTTLSLVTSGRGTTNQTTRLLGSFADANASGWQTWHWIPMRDSHGNLATVSLGGVQTLRLTSGNSLNVHFVMLVPTFPPVLNASISGSTVSIEFPTVVQHNYTVLYNNTLIGGTWLPLSAPVPGDGTFKIVTDTATGQTRFYKLQIQ
jgi:hypothetical protein